MPWQDRLKPCTYTSPSGAVFNLQYEDVSQSLKKKTTTFEFVGTNDVYVQDNGVGARTIPLTIYFSGEDHDLQANDFFEAIAESGAGQLQHPVYGLQTVNPVGDPSRSDRLKTGANESAFDITFVVTITNLYPASQSNIKANAQSASDAFNNATAEEYDELITLNTESERQTLIGDSQDLLGTYKEGLQDLTNGQADLQRDFNDIHGSINDGIDLLVGQPLTLAFQSIQLVKSVSNAAALIEDRLDAYGNLLDDLTNDDKTVAPTYDFVANNRLATQNLYASATVSAMNDAMVSTDFKTRDEALEASVKVTDYFAQYMAWKERNYAALDQLDTGEGYVSLQEQTALTASLLIDVSLDLKRQRTIILDRDMFVIDFAYQYFGSTDNATVEEVIKLNGLDNSEIWVIPKNRLMKFYEE
jgi:prophage DNA circulation protein